MAEKIGVNRRSYSTKMKKLEKENEDNILGRLLFEHADRKMRRQEISPVELVRINVQLDQYEEEFPVGTTIYEKKSAIEERKENVLKLIETIEDLDKKILESLDAAGCNTFQKIRYGIMPQLFTNFVSTVIYRFEINIKDASTLGLVGAGGIGAPLIFAMNSLSWDEVGAILCGLVILVLIVEYISTKVRNKLARG